LLGLENISYLLCFFFPVLLSRELHLWPNEQEIEVLTLLVFEISEMKGLFLLLIIIRIVIDARDDVHLLRLHCKMYESAREFFVKDKKTIIIKNCPLGNFRGWLNNFFEYWRLLKPKGKITIWI